MKQFEHEISTKQMAHFAMFALLFSLSFGANADDSNEVVARSDIKSHVPFTREPIEHDPNAAAEIASEVEALEKEIEAQESVQQESLQDVAEDEAADEGEHFDIFEYRVDGNTKLTNLQIETAVYPHLGEKKTFTDVSDARDALEKAYHEAGYLSVLVDIPEQEVADKIVTLKVTEGKIGKLRIKNATYYSLGRIKELAPSLKEGEVPNFDDVQKDIARLNRTSDRRVTPVMKAGKKFGTVDVELKVEDKAPVHGNLELNDRYSQDTTRWRLGGSISYDNLWRKDHSLSLSFLTSPEDFSEVKVLSANYLSRFDNSNMLFAVYGVVSDSDISTIGGTNILGDAKILGARLIKPLPSAGNYYHSLSLGIDFKKIGQRIMQGSDEFDQPITYAPLSASYTGTWQHKKSVTQLTTSGTFGLRSFLADEAEFEERRAGANPNFFVAKVDLNHTHNFDNGMQALAKIGGQFSGTELIANEQYLAGGADSVRGYLESQAAGDRGVYHSIALRSPQLFSNVNWLNNFTASAFHDFAYLNTINPAEGQDEDQTLSSAGVGIQLQAMQHLNLTWYAAWALTDNGRKEKGDFQSHMRLWYDF